ncbi:small cardioactive peptides-like isoform X2 [Littorina saxatilis]
MESSACRMLLAVLFATAIATEAMAYIAFPRMGRGYLAFPRLGRSGSDAGQDGGACCKTGLKTEWVLSEDGKTSQQNVCAADSCCQGLQEIVGEKPDGAYYSLCIPSCSADSKLTSSSETVLRKLKRMLAN